ncbi:MAG TPA: sigma-70 family RNA polymerase sigma factor [Myxococcota bacterium]|jgi:RNA polymerase sigma factor for flagellar operon FliA
MSVVESYLWLVRAVAKKIARRLPSAVDVEDLVGAGTLGLIDAANRFDPARPSTFPAYAEIRIRGAILDHLRQSDWLPRAARQQSRRAEDAERRLGSPIAVPAASVRSVHSVEDLREDGFEGFASEAPTANEHIERGERSARLGSALQKLTPRARLVLSLYYVEDLTLKQIGARFGITESRACQLHGNALDKLRGELKNDADLAAAA